MDAKEYIRERERMLNAFGRTDGRCNGVSCVDCPLYQDEEDCVTEEAVDIVEKWSKEHPKKTYLSVLLELFPNTRLGITGTPMFCPVELGAESYCNGTCGNCKACWGQEYKEEDND